MTADAAPDPRLTGPVPLSGGNGRRSALISAPAPTADLLAEIRPDILRYAQRRLGYAAAFTTAEDVTQDVMLAVWLALPRFRDEGKPVLALARTIAQRRIVDAQRAYRDVTVAEVPDPPDHRPGPEHLAIAADQARRLARLLSNLPDRHREIVVLRIAMGLSADEVGTLLGMTAGAVRIAHLRALARLRRWSR